MHYVRARPLSERRRHGNHREGGDVRGSGEAGSPVELKSRYDNFIGGHWVPR